MVYLVILSIIKRSAHKPDSFSPIQNYKDDKIARLWTFSDSQTFLTLTAPSAIAPIRQKSLSR